MTSYCKLFRYCCRITLVHFVELPTCQHHNKHLFVALLQYKLQFKVQISELINENTQHTASFLFTLGTIKRLNKAIDLVNIIPRAMGKMFDVPFFHVKSNPFVWCGIKKIRSVSTIVSNCHIQTWEVETITWRKKEIRGRARERERNSKVENCLLSPLECCSHCAPIFHAPFEL